MNDDSDDSLEVPSKAQFVAKLKVGQHVAVQYDDKWFVAQIERRMADDDLDVKCMKSKGFSKFVWPENIDKLTYPMSDVLCLVSDPVKVNDRYNVMSLSKED